MFSTRAFLVIFLAVITGTVLGAGVTVWMMRESSLGERLGFVSTETTATLLTAQKKELESARTFDPDSKLTQLLADRTSLSGDNSEALQAMAQRIEDLTAQHAALSRDLESLRFRVDTHSTSFRPLQSEEVGDDNRLRPLGN